jgi:hypothetical protein
MDQELLKNSNEYIDGFGNVHALLRKYVLKIVFMKSKISADILHETGI